MPQRKTQTKLTQTISNIVIENIDCKISFIHSSSGKVNGVTISYLTDSHYEKRFLSIRRYL